MKEKIEVDVTYFNGDPHIIINEDERCINAFDIKRGRVVGLYNEQQKDALRKKMDRYERNKKRGFWISLGIVLFFVILFITIIITY